jgi:hypothetical protein
MIKRVIFMLPGKYNTVVEAISDLQARGFTEDFTIVDDQLFCAQEKCYIKADEFAVLWAYDFHCGSRKKKKILYVIESTFLRGILLDSGPLFGNNDLVTNDGN